jgi:hypothetical protein
MFRNIFISINGKYKMELSKNQEKENENKNDNENNVSMIRSVWSKVMIFYNKNKKELFVVLCLLIVYNFICPISYEYVSSNKQSGGEGEELAQMAQASTAAPPAAAPSAGEAPVPSEKDAKKAEKIAEKQAKQQAKQAAKQMPGQDGKEKAKSFAKKLKGFNVLQKMLGWMLSLVQSLMTFAGLVLVLAVLPGLPIFIFMLILFFILRSRVAVIKAY